MFEGLRGLHEALEVMPQCGHWQEQPNAWSWREPEEGEYRIVCEAIIEVATGQRYCLDEGPRVEPHQMERWLAAASRVEWMVTPCDDCGGTGEDEACWHDVMLYEHCTEDHPCPSCVGGLRPSPEATEAGAEAIYDADDAYDLTWEDQGERNGVRDWYRDKAEAVIRRLLLEADDQPGTTAKRVSVEHGFLPVNDHPDDDECTYRSDGTDDTYCGLPEAAHEGGPNELEDR